MRLLILGLGVLIAGCGSVPKQCLNSDVSTAQPELYLDSLNGRDARVERFLIEYSKPTEQEKITYLLSSIRSSGVEFTRNGSHYDGAKAAGWLRWKMRHRQYRSNPILTARDFVERVSEGSVATGVPYEIIYSNGSRCLLRAILRDELQALENALRARDLEKTISDVQGYKATVKDGTVAQKPPILPPAPAK